MASNDARLRDRQHLADNAAGSEERVDSSTNGDSRSKELAKCQRALSGFLHGIDELAQTDSMMRDGMSSAPPAADHSGIMLSSSPQPTAKRKRVDSALPSRIGPVTNAKQHQRRPSGTRKAHARPLIHSINHSRALPGDVNALHLQSTLAENRVVLQQTFLASTHSGTATTCAICGMSYVRSRQEDTTLHRKYCERSTADFDWTIDRIRATPRTSGKESFLVVDIDHGRLRHPKVVRIDRLGISSKLELKIRKLAEHVDESLGALPLPENVLSQCIFFVFTADLSTSIKGASFATTQTVIGFAVVQRICKAFRVVTPVALSSGGNDRLMSHADSDGPALYGSANAVPALLGVHRIWTDPKYRRQGIANKLLNHIAGHSVYGMPVLDNESVAFSQPTNAGQQLFSAWAGTPNFMVFDTP